MAASFPSSVPSAPARDLNRGINCLAVPVIAVKIHSVAHDLYLVEKALSMLPLESLPDDDGEDHRTGTRHVVVDAVIELERIRNRLLALEAHRD